MKRKKRTTRTQEIEEAVIETYKKGLSLRETQESLASSGVNISTAMIRNIVDDFGLLRKRGRSLGETRIKDKTNDGFLTEDQSDIDEKLTVLSDQLTTAIQAIADLQERMAELKECLFHVFKDDLEAAEETEEEELEQIEDQIKKISKKEDFSDHDLGEDIHDIENRKRKDDDDFEDYDDYDDFDDDYDD